MGRTRGEAWGPVQAWPGRLGAAHSQEQGLASSKPPPATTSLESPARAIHRRTGGVWLCFHRKHIAGAGPILPPGNLHPYGAELEPCPSLELLGDLSWARASPALQSSSPRAVCQPPWRLGPPEASSRALLPRPSPPHPGVSMQPSSKRIAGPGDGV